MRRVAVRRGLLDHPNARSSHATPTPRGGGLSIASVWLAWIAASAFVGDANPMTASAIGLGAALVAGVGFADDHRHVSAAIRFAVHLVAVGIALWALGGVPLEPLASTGANVFLLQGLAVLACVWFVNLFNFMDGIDGIAASESATVSLGAAWLTWLLDGPAWLTTSWLVLAGGSVGFLAHNWPPARIFMGDVGSGFLGFAIGALLVASTHVAGFTVWTALILVAAFSADATVTLVRRAARGEKWYAAHRSHAYQHLARRWRSHRTVTLLFVGIEACVLLPLAFLSTAVPTSGPWLAAITLVVLCTLAWLAGAGEPGETAPSST
jgi:Fuc2NAc and GlcNAc transferase